MLKIIDDYDLKGLEKFGYFKNENYNYLKYLVDKPYYLDCIQIDINTRIITRHIKEMGSPEIQCKKVHLGFIHDLIESKIVEKIEE